MPLQTNLIAYSSHASEVKEWFYYSAVADQTREQTEKQGGEEHRMGPISKDEIKTLFYKGKVCHCIQLWPFVFFFL
jgi:hypothetical protein